MTVIYKCTHEQMQRKKKIERLAKNDKNAIALALQESNFISLLQ